MHKTSYDTYFKTSYHVLNENYFMKRNDTYMLAHIFMHIHTECFTNRPTNLQEVQGTQRLFGLKQECKIKNIVVANYCAKEK